MPFIRFNMHLSAFTMTIFLAMIFYQSNGFLFDGKPLFPPASTINNSSTSSVIQVTGGKGGKGGAGDIPGKDGDSNVQTQTIDDHKPMKMSHTYSDGKTKNMFMLMNHDQQLNNSNKTEVSNSTDDYIMFMDNNEQNKSTSLFMLPKEVHGTKIDNQLAVEITGGNGADASDGGENGVNL